MPQAHRPIIFMLFSTLSLSLSALAAKYLSDQLSIELLSLMRFLIPAVVIFIVLSFSKITIPKRAMWGTLAIRAVTVTACQLCFLLALGSLTLVESVVLFGTGPLFIPLLEKLFFGVTIKSSTKLGLLLTFIGVILLAGDVSGITLKPELLYGLGAGLFNAATQLSLYRATKGDLTPLEINGWGFLLASICVLPLLAYNGFSSQDLMIINEPIVHSEIWAVLIILSALIINTQLFRVKAYKLVESNSQLAPLIFTNLLFATLWQKLFFAENFTHSQLAGISLVISASMIQVFTPTARALLIKVQEKISVRSV